MGRPLFTIAGNLCGEDRFKRSANIRAELEEWPLVVFLCNGTMFLQAFKLWKKAKVRLVFR